MSRLRRAFGTPIPTYSDTRNILVAGAFGMAKLPLGTKTHTDSSAESSNEQSDIRKEIGQISKKSVREIEARNKDIQQLENSIKDLHDSFKTMLTLTQDQVCTEVRGPRTMYFFA